MKELNDDGIEIMLCEQTASYRQITKNIKLPEVKRALSAITALM